MPFLRAPGSKGVHSLLPHIILALAILLFLGKLLHLPVALLVVSGASMAPTYRVGDLVVAVSPRLRGFGVGDVVVYCFDLWRTSCVMHRVVEISQGHVVTKGDANPAPDPYRVPVGAVLYVVVLSVPLYVWVPLAVALAFLYLLGASRVHGVLESPASTPPGLLLTLVLALYFLLNAAAVGLLYVSQAQPYFRPPVVGLVQGGLDLELHRYTVAYELGGLEIVGASCHLENGQEAEAHVNGSSWLFVEIPKRFFEWLWERDSGRHSYLPAPPASVHTSFTINCTILLDKGVLTGVYVASLTWREPVIHVRGPLAVFINVNPVDLGASVEVVDVARGTIIHRGPLLLNAHGSVELNVTELAGGSGTYVVRLYYTFLGLPRAQGVEVHA